MLLTIAVLAISLGIAGGVYLVRERLGLAGLGLALLRWVALAIIGLLLLNPSWSRRAAPGPPTVLLDASLSMAAGGTWTAALDTARVLGGAGGVALRFGAALTPLDAAPPTDGASRAREALATAQALGRPAFLVTDGELDDGAALSEILLRGVTPVVVPRTVGRGVALSDVSAPALVRRSDTVRVAVVVERWGDLAEATGRLELYEGGRRLLVRSVTLPAGARRVRREATLAPGVFERGDRVLRLVLSVDGDPEPQDNERLRVISVTDRPTIVLIVDPADWEGRFLLRTLTDVGGAAVEGYARAGDDRWLDMRRAQPATESRVRDAARRAELVVVRAERLPGFLTSRTTALWHWPAGTGASLFQGDWYALGDVEPSPLAGAFAGVRWDSVPPLSGVLPLETGEDAWVALSARQGRRGPSRPVLIGNEAEGRRTLVTAGAGVWRWAFRGGVSREAYRGLLAAGVDWLLRSTAEQRAGALVAGTVVSRGMGIPFRWVGTERPDTTRVEFASGERTDTVTLAYDERGEAVAMREPGVYRWRALGTVDAAGTSVVETYSPEYVPRTGGDLVPADAGAGRATVEVFLREWWWLVLVAMTALVVEWAWRRRRGLP